MRGQECSLEVVTFHLSYLFNTNLWRQRSVLAGPGDSEVTDTGPCLDNDEVESGRPVIDGS